MKKLIHILSYIRPYTGYAFLNISCNVISVVFSLFSITMIIPFLDLIFLKTLEDYGRHAQEIPANELSVDAVKSHFYQYFSELILLEPENGKLKALAFLCVLIIVMIFFKNLFRYLAMFFVARIRNGVSRDLRNQIYTKLLHLPLSYYSEERKGDIIARVSNDVQEVEWTILTSIEMLFRDPLAIIVFLGAMLVMSPQMTLFVFLLLPITGLLIGWIGKSLKRTSILGQAKMGYLISVIEETLSGLRIIKAFNGEKGADKKFRRLNDEYHELMVKMYRKRDLSAPMSEFLGISVLVIIIWFGGNLVLHQDTGLSASVFIAYIAIFSQLIPPSKSFTTAYYNLQKGAASAERIGEILNADISIKEKPDAISIAGFRENIEYRGVSFRYQVEDVLKNINLKIEKGKTIALVGSSGGGKSTLADLLPRFHDPVQGQVIIDGVPITDCRIRDLRSLMGVVTQESILFNDTIFNNIAFGVEHTGEEEVVKAAKIANAHAFIMEMKNGYQTNIGDSGGKLSGGQRQRISIARAVLKNPPILILDEATSALDTESEQLVQEALFNLMKNRTSLVIAHRLSTIQNADEIVVIERGEIIERGTHPVLLKKNGVYKKLYDLQSFS